MKRHPYTEIVCCCGIPNLLGWFPNDPADPVTRSRRMRVHADCCPPMRQSVAEFGMVMLAESARGKPNFISRDQVYEVRCCCVPQSVLGWMPLQRDLHEITGTLVFPQEIDGEFGEIRLPFMKYGEADFEYRGFVAHMVSKRVWWCLKAEGVPIEKLRQIQGFIENHGDHR
jgi:hypothetical protein